MIPRPPPIAIAAAAAFVVAAAQLGCSDDWDRPAVDFVQREGSRLLKVQSVGLAAFGPINPHTASPEHAALAFGEPSAVVRRGELCEHRWPDVGLTIELDASEDGDSCGPAAGIESIRLDGRAAAEAGWRTAEGIRPRMAVAAMHRIYPEARPAGPGAFVLVEPPHARRSGLPPVLEVSTANGRVDGLYFPIDAGPG